MTMELLNEEPMDDGIDLQQYLNLFWHWLWLILLAAVVAAVTAFFISRSMVPYFESSTTLLVNAAPATKSTDYSSAMLSEQLTSTYSQMISKDPVLEEVIIQLGLPMSTEDLREMITVASVSDTQLIEVTVETTDPILSANIANVMAAAFAKQIEGIESARFTQSKSTLETQLADLEEQIAAYQEQAKRASDEEESRLDSKVTQYREIYSNLLQSYESVRLSEAQAVSSVVQVEPAKADYLPVKPKVMQNTLLAGVLGLLLAAGAVVLRETLDDSIKTPDDISRKFHLPVLGVINHHSTGDKPVVTLSDPRSPTAEAYRTLRTNVSYTSVDKPLRMIMITSSEPGEGKSTTVSNLGVVLAQSGRKVIIADCDLRHPRMHVYFGLPNRHGISNLFALPSEAIDATRQPTQVDYLSVISAGPQPPNPAELLGSKKMQRILGSMQQLAEIILIDTPPLLAVTDAAVLAPNLDGVLIVVRPGKTRCSALRQTIEQLNQVKANVLGVVLNDVVTKGNYYGYHYHYYRNYAAYQDYYGGDSRKKEGKLHLKIGKKK